MAKRHVLGRRQLRAVSIASLASGMVILCLLALLFPSLRALVPEPLPVPQPSGSPAPAPVPPSASSTMVPAPQASAPLGDDAQLDWPQPNWVDPNPPPAPGEKR